MIKHHESHITFGTEPNGQHKSGSIQVYTLFDRQDLIDQPSLPKSRYVMIMLYRTSGAEEMKSIINRTSNINKKIPEGLMTILYKKKTANMERRTYAFSSMKLE